MHGPRQISRVFLARPKAAPLRCLRPSSEKTGVLREKSPLTQEKRRNFEHSLLGPVYIIG
jgi:hypothetical protein